MNDNGFYTIPSPSLYQDLRVDETSRLLRRDIERREALPFELTAGARTKGTVGVLFYANASAGNFVEYISENGNTNGVGFGTVPLAMLWHLGCVDKNNEIVALGAGPVATVYEADSNFPGEGTTIFSGAKAVWSCDKEAITLVVSSTNVGWPVYIIAWFYFVAYYDDTGVKEFGL